MREFNEIWKDATKVDELSVAQLFICYTGVKEYIKAKIQSRKTIVSMIYDSATEKGIVKTADDFPNETGYNFDSALSCDRDSYHHITDNADMDFFIPDTENIDTYIEINNELGKLIDIRNKCADKINNGGYLQMFFAEDSSFNL